MFAFSVHNAIVIDSCSYPLTKYKTALRPFPMTWEGAKAERLAFLLELYHTYTSLLPIPETVKAKRKKNIT
jgi:hypothetical protein